MMPRVFAVLTLLCLVAVQTGPMPAAAEDSPLRALQGHWRCTGGDDVERSYLYYRHFPKGATRQRIDFYGRADDVDGAGSIEHVSRATENDPYVSRGPEGDGTGTVAADGAFVVTGTDPATHQPFTVTTALVGGTLTRTSATSTGTVTEHCTAEPVITPTTCAHPNQAPHMLRSAPIGFAGHYGTVAVIVTLDDRSEVLWTEVQSHLGETEDSMAEQATRESQYQTEVIDCRAMPGQYIFTAVWADH